MTTKDMMDAAERYAKPIQINDVRKEVQHAFEVGARWAAEHIPSLWISVKDKQPHWNDEEFIDLRCNEKHEDDLYRYVVRLNNSHNVIVAYCSKSEISGKLRWLNRGDIDIFHVVNDGDYYMPLPPIKRRK